LKSKAKPRTIAFRGLPRGALAMCSTSGLAIRSLESISPLDPSSTFFLHTATNHNAPDKKSSADLSKVPSDTPLSSKFLLVHLDHPDICPAEYIGKAFASATEFYNALPSRTDLSRVKINYDMEVLADPVFAPWDFVQVRLESSGLLDADHTEDDDSAEGLGPLLYVVQLQWDGSSKVSGDVSWYKEYVDSTKTTKDDLQWAIVEASERDAPSVLVGVPLDLLEHSERTDNQHQLENTPQRQRSRETDDMEEVTSGCDKDLIPLPSGKVANIQLPASLLQKAIRRGTGLCSSAPLLEACGALLLPKESSNSGKAKQPPEGTTLAMLKAVWGCMLVDASPFDDTDGCMGLPSFMLLSLVAKADPQWTMPMSLCHAAVAGALRTAKSAPSQPWLGFVERSDDWFLLEKEPSNDTEDQKACNLRNIMRAAQTAAGGRIAWGKWNSFVGDSSGAAVLAYLNDKWTGSYLVDAPLPLPNEAASLRSWEACKPSVISHEETIRRLDKECRLAAIEPSVMPSTLVLLQALLSEPPTKWKKHGLPSLSKQIRKLLTEANARIKERVQLARLATWGKEARTALEGQSSSRSACESDEESAKAESLSATYKSYREAVTPTGTLSEQESEVVDCFEAIQEWVAGRVNCVTAKPDQDMADSSIIPTITQSSLSETVGPRYRQIKAGPPLTPFDRRVAFLWHLQHP